MGFWVSDFSVSTGSTLYVTPDGSGVVLGTTGGAGSTFFNGCVTLPNLYSEIVYGFSGCDTQISTVTISDASVLTGQETSLPTLVSLYYIGANYFNAYGTDQICAFHQTCPSLAPAPSRARHD